MKITIIAPPLMHYPFFGSVSFVNPGSHNHKKRKNLRVIRVLPPYGAGCITAHLRKKGYDVFLNDMVLSFVELKKDIYDLKKEKDISGRILKYLKNGSSDKIIDDFAEKLFKYAGMTSNGIAAFSVFSRLGLPCSLLLAKKIKHKTGQTVLFGGALMTEYAGYSDFNKLCEFMDNYRFIDYVIYGSGEEPFVELIKHIEGKAGAGDVHSLVYRKDGRVIKNKRLLSDIDAISAPDFSDIPLEEYKKIHYRQSKSSNMFKYSSLQLPYQITRGCDQNCGFCNLRLVDPKMELKTPAKVIQELIYMRDKYRTNHFVLCSCRFNNSYDYVDKLCSLIIKKKLKLGWVAIAAIANMDKNLIKKMSKAGCYALVWALESGSDSMLRAMRKDHTAEQAASVIKASSKAGIINVVSIISGFIGELESDTDKTIDFIKRNSRYIDGVRLFDFTLLPDSFAQKNPEKYSICNIRVSSDSTEGFTKLEYDRDSGQKWESIIDKKRNNYRKIIEFLNNSYLEK